MEGVYRVIQYSDNLFMIQRRCEKIKKKGFIFRKIKKTYSWRLIAMGGGFPVSIHGVFISRPARFNSMKKALKHIEDIKKYPVIFNVY
ncbi:hypothetical protein M2T79_12465 [Elizabethkingia miricola]|uniref:hypothetical protein n=1 Tax=Elizabethkingia miricola TaxID=172045 RepID=UPI0020191979|nr:hypothetical protein [Elizabethkingia miricola]MCL1657410.1 hypothetical protein [Elizabethkingia miricola]